MLWISLHPPPLSRQKVEQFMTVCKTFTDDCFFRSKIARNTLSEADYGGDFEQVDDHGTTHISIIDPDGNAVSVTSTINLL